MSEKCDRPGGQTQHLALITHRFARGPHAASGSAPWWLVYVKIGVVAGPLPRALKYAHVNQILVDGATDSGSSTMTWLLVSAPSGTQPSDPLGAFSPTNE